MSNNLNKMLKSIRIYSFNKDKIIKCIHSERNSNNIEKKNPISNYLENNKKKIVNFFIPEQDDSLFWCWYIFKYGLDNFKQITKKYFSIEKKSKIGFIDKIRKNKDILKKNKVKISSMEGHLANDSILNIMYLEPMLIIDKFNFCYLDDKIFYTNTIFTDNKTCIIKYFKNKKKYGILLFKNKFKDLTKNLFKVENILKPIKSISNYKAQELRDIASKLDINVMKTATKYKTKKELYILICEKI